MQRGVLLDRWKEKQGVGPQMRGKCGDGQGNEERDKK